MLNEVHQRTLISEVRTWYPFPDHPSEALLDNHAKPDVALLGIPYQVLDVRFGDGRFILHLTLRSNRWISPAPKERSRSNKSRFYR